MNTSKRAVARHACLACREKKVKCDGEVPVPPGEKQVELKTQRCTNCKVANIQCVFVRSQRGGRRKRDQKSASEDEEYSLKNIQQQKSKTSNNSPRPIEIISSFQPTTSNTTTILSTPSPNTLKDNNDFYQGPKLLNNHDNELIHTMHPFTQQHHQQPHQFRLQSQPINHQPLQNPTLNHQSLQTQPLQGQPLQNQSFTQPLQNPSLQSQPLLPNYSYSWSQASLPNNTVLPNNESPPFGYQQLNPPQQLQHPQPQPQPQLSIPPMSHTSSSSQLSPSYPSYPTFQQQNNYIPIQATSPNPMKRSLTSDIDNYNIPKYQKVEDFIRLTNNELDKFELPNWKTTCILIDLYYRYIHPSRPFLPPKSRMLYQFQIRTDVSLLHAMFSCSSRYASNLEIPDPKLRDPQHWYFLAEKYWDLLTLESSLQALVLLMGALGPGGYVEQSIEGSERFKKKIDVTGFFQTLYIKDWKEYTNYATKNQVITYEDMLRTVWGSWKLNVFLRINRGFPFSRISTNLVEFESDLPFPLSDDLYNSNLKIFDSNDPLPISSLRYKTWNDFQIHLENAKTDKSEYSKFTDSSSIIIAVRTMEDIMDTIVGGILNSSTILTFNERIKLIEDITNVDLYTISHIKKKMIVLNISRLFALLILAVAKVVINVTQCAQILLIKPHETNSNSNPDDVFNSLYESNVETVTDATMSLTPEQLHHYFTSFNSALEAVRLIEIGMGIVPEEVNSLNPATAIGGPSIYTSASEISSMTTTDAWWTTGIPEQGKLESAHVHRVNEFPDCWIQFPIFSIVVIANALTVLSSSIVLTKIFNINEVSTNNGIKHIDVVINNGARIIPVQLNEADFENCIKSFNIVSLQEKVRLCSRFIHTHGKYWPYVETISVQAEAIISHVEEVVQRMG